MNALKKTLKDSALMRWLMLILISGMMFATYWFYDFFSPLKDLMIKELDITSSQFGTIISATTWANAFGMIIVGGVFLDRFGIRLAAVVFGLLTTLGAGIVALGASDAITTDPGTKIWVMVVGRLLFGSGLEISCVVITRTCVKWFKGHELAMAMAINVGFGRLGSFLAINLSRGIAEATISPAVNLAAGLVGAGFLMLMAYLVFDVKIDRQIEAEGQEDEPFRFSDLLALITNRSFIFIALLCVAFYSAVFPFIQYAPDLLVNKFGFTDEMPSLVGLGFWEKARIYLTNGSKVASFIPLGTILFTPIFGFFVDRRGKAATIMIAGGVLLIFAHLSLSVFNSVVLGYAGLLSLGIAFSLVPAAMWPSVAKIVAENRLGTAYATMFTIQNWGLGTFFWGIGKVLDESNPGVAEAKAAGEQVAYDYTNPILMLVVLGAVSIVLAFLLKAADKKQGFGLELPSNATTQTTEASE